MPGTDPAIAVYIACNATPPWPVGSAIEFIATGDDGLQNGTTDQSKYLFKFVLDGSTVKNWSSDNYYYLPIATPVGDHSLVVSCSTDSGVTTDATSTFTFRVATGEYPATGEKRYTCNGVLNISGTPGSMLSQLLDSMDGNAVYSQGVWEIWSGSPKTAEPDIIDESWLAGNISFNVGSNKNSLINTAKGTFVDPNDHWASTGFPTVQIQDYVDADLEELTLDLTLNFTTSGFMAQRLARIKMERSRRGMSVTYPCNMKALGVKVNEVRRVNNTLLGWVAKEFRVLDWSFATNGGINLTLGEEDASIYNVSSADLQPLPLPFHTALPSPWKVKAPTELTAAETLKPLSNGNGYFTQVNLSWVPADATAYKYLVYMDGVLVDQQLEPYSILVDVSEGPHTFGVVAVNTLGSKSAATVLDYTVLGKKTPPSDVPWVLADNSRITWGVVSDVDLSGYEIRVHSGKNYDWGTAVAINNSGLFTTSPVAMPVNLYGETTVMIKAVDTSGNYSKSEASAVVDLGNASDAVANVLYQYDHALLAWPGTIAGGTLSGHPIANSSTLMWSTNDQTLMWADDTTTPMWSNLFADMTYLATVQVSDFVTGSRVMISYDYAGSSISVQYRINGTSRMWSDDSLLMWSSDSDLMWTVEEWRAWPGSVPAQFGEYQFLISIAGGLIQGELIDFVITVDAPDIEESLFSVSLAATTGSRLPITKTYRAIKGAKAQLISGGTARTVEVIDKNITGPLLGAYDSSHNLVAGTIDVTVSGY